MSPYKRNKHSTNKYSKGFTLVELLVVISIIGMLASITLVLLKSARIKARDSRRIADINRLSTALQLYYDKYGNLPSCSSPGYAGGCDITNLGSPGSMLDSSLDGHFMEFLSEFVKGKVKDPLNTLNPPYLYGYAVGDFPIGSGNYYYYFVGTRLEDTNNSALKNSSIQDPLFSEWYVLAERILP